MNVLIVSVPKVLAIREHVYIMLNCRTWLICALFILYHLAKQIKQVERLFIVSRFERIRVLLGKNKFRQKIINFQVLPSMNVTMILVN